MIFVTVGTTDFDGLAARMDDLAPTFEDKVVIQFGRGRYQPRHAACFRFAPTLDDYYRQADLVVSHGGLGAVVEVLRLGKPLVGVSNPDRYDSHQDELLRALSDGGYLVWCRNLDALADDLERARLTLLRPYEEPPCRIHEVIRDRLSGRGGPPASLPRRRSGV